MGFIRSVRGFKPEFGTDCYIAPNATITGDVIMGNECTVWFNAVIRGDVNSIRIGNRVNIQDGVVMHCTFEKSTILVGDNVSIGHNVVVHGAEIKENVLIGIGAILLDDSVIGENSIIAAGSVVLAGTVVPPGTIYGGVPAKFIKKVNEEQNREMIRRIADNYLMYASWYKDDKTT